MPRQKGKRKGNASFLESIGPALLPAAALTAVPWCPGPQFPGGNPLSLALVAFPRDHSGAQEEPSGAQTPAGPSTSGGAAASAAGDVDDSFDEDDDIEEAGYSTVAQALGTGGNRQSYSDRGRVPTPPSQRNVATTSHVTNMKGEIYHILEPEEGEPPDTDIYALPNKGKGLGKKTLGQHEEGETTMDHTQQTVRKAMQDIHDTPVEETMLRLSEGRQTTGSSSGRGTMWREDNSDDEPPPLPPPPKDMELEALSQHSDVVEGTQQPRKASGQAIVVGLSSDQPPSSMEPTFASATLMKQTSSTQPYPMEAHKSSVEAIAVLPSSSLPQSMEPPSESDATTSVSELVTAEKRGGAVTVKRLSVPSVTTTTPTTNITTVRRVNVPPAASTNNNTVSTNPQDQTEVKEPAISATAAKRGSVQLSARKQESAHATPVLAETSVKRGSAQLSARKPESAYTTPSGKGGADLPLVVGGGPATPLKRDPVPRDTPSPLKLDVPSPRSAESELSATPRDVPSLPLEHSPSPVPAEAVPPPLPPAPAAMQQQQQKSSLFPSEADTPSTVRKKKKLLKKREKEKGEKQVTRQQDVAAAAVAAEEQMKMAASAPAVRSGGSGSKPQHTITTTTPAATPIQRAAVTTPRQPSTSRPPSPSPSLKREMQRVREENQKLQNEITGLRKMAAAIGAGAEGGTSTRRSSQISDELKGENEALKNAVGRLNQELSRYQAAFRPLSADDQSRLQALPNKGPIPSWLINKRYLSPLFLAYDDLIQEKEEVIHRCQAQLQALKKRTEEVVRENQQYERRISGNVAIIAASDWQALQEQARLVLEENQVLTEQVQLQHSKVKDMTSTHMHQVSRLTQQLTDCEVEREEVERQLEEMRGKLRDVKHKHDRLQLEAVKKTSLYEHANTVAGLHRSVIDEEQQSEQEKEEMMHKLKASEEERKRQAQIAVETKAENQHLKAELSAMQHAVKRSQNRLLLLQKAIRLSESKELVTQNELANVIKMVEKTALERDTAFRVAKEQQRDCKSTVDRIADSGVIMSKMEEKLQTYKLRASAKLKTVADKLKEQDDLFNSQRQEYEREIVYLRQLLREKEDRIGQLKDQHRDMEESLETVWQASKAENQRLRDTLADTDNRLHQHPSLHATLLEHDDMERLLTFD